MDMTLDTTTDAANGHDERDREQSASRPLSPFPLARRGIVSHVPVRTAAGWPSLSPQLDRLWQATFYNDIVPSSSVGFISALHDEGTTVTARLAAAMLSKRRNGRVTLIDCNWDRPALHTVFDLDPGPGLADWLNGEADAKSIRHETPQGITIVPAGLVTDTLELTKRFRMRGLRDLISEDNFVIVDLPPVIPCGYAAGLAELVDSLVLVTRARATPTAAIVQARAMLDGLPLVGAILNDARTGLPAWLERLL